MKRSRIDIIKDILEIIKNNHNSILYTPLLRKTNLSSSRFKEYYSELLEKSLIKEIKEKTKSKTKNIEITPKGQLYLEKYSVIKGFIEDFGL